MKHVIQPENLQFLFREKNNNGAEFTAKSLITGKDYTFSVSRSLFNNVWYTHVYVETGYQNFTRLGNYFKGKIYNKRAEVSTPSSDAIAWILRRIENREFSVLQQNVEIMHTGSCIVCGQKLTDAESIRLGVGPICRQTPKFKK